MLKINPQLNNGVNNVPNNKANNVSNNWTQAFTCNKVKPLIICRGPVRKEALDVFADLGIERCGILISDKDSIAQDTVGAPELRRPRLKVIPHPLSDYSAATATARALRIEEIIAICKRCDYDSVFAGYGFMAEDLNLVTALEIAGIHFIGPNSKVVYAAGFKDEAKRIATEADISVVPGVDELTALTLLTRYPDIKSLKDLVLKKSLKIATSHWQEGGQEGGQKVGQKVGQDDKANTKLISYAIEVLLAAQNLDIELFAISELCEEAVRQAEKLFQQHPKLRLRLKAVGGGGGKGQRIVPSASNYDGTLEVRAKLAATPVAAMVRDILSEAKATSARDNRNILIELNIEETRHQEIQMVGNGDWVLCMGGRDCSVQMFEQKLLEFSVTPEALLDAEQQALAANDEPRAKRLHRENEILKNMQDEATRFAKYVGLNSVSTFECIVAADNHYFMEVNTRIQVEHRVSELCYTLRFYDPKNHDDYFDVDSLVALMVLLMVHGKRLPQPELIPSNGAALEARLNASNAALQPHAGGVVEYWSPQLATEIRDHQGISDRHPVTGRFMPYRLIGHYDSNIALLLCCGADREDTLNRLAEILSNTQLIGTDLETNLNFQQGLVYWLLGHNPEARLSTAFVPAYLAHLAQLTLEVKRFDIDSLWSLICKRYLEDDTFSYDEVLIQKSNLLLRPLKALLACPHLLSGWLAYRQHAYHKTNTVFGFNQNPLMLLEQLYAYLGMHSESDSSTARIWSDDAAVLAQGRDFYKTLTEKLKIHDYSDVITALAKESAPKGFSAGLWQETLNAHRAHQCGVEILLAPVILADLMNFYALGINADLSESIPKALLNAKTQKEALLHLAPPPEHNADEIVAPSGGMFYRRELPNLPPLVEKGQHFKKGTALGVIEVMKMFNKIYASFSGVIDEVLLDEDGAVIKKGQPLFKVTPDHSPAAATADVSAAERKRYTENIYKRMTLT